MYNIIYISASNDTYPRVIKTCNISRSLGQVGLGTQFLRTIKLNQCIVVQGQSMSLASRDILKSKNCLVQADTDDLIVLKKCGFYFVYFFLDERLDLSSNLSLNMVFLAYHSQIGACEPYSVLSHIDEHFSGWTEP